MVLVLLGGLAWFLASQLPAELTLATLSAIGGLFFLSVAALRMLCFLPFAPGSAGLERLQLPATSLPVYSVLVPLFRETRVLPQLISALGSLRYPALGSKRTKT